MSTPDQIVTAVRRAVIHLSTQGSRFARAHGVNLTDIRALVVLLDLQRDGEATTPGALGSGLGLASASTTQVIDRLEQRGLVVRERDTSDRRRVSVHVTDQAMESGVASFEPLLQSVRDLARRRSAADQRVILAFLDDLATLTPNDE